MSGSADPRPFLVFDLDDTLYKEHTYTKSCFQFVCDEIRRLVDIDFNLAELYRLKAIGDADPIHTACSSVGISATDCAGIVSKMRAHAPLIKLSHDASLLVDLLRARQIKFGIVTDGRSVTQRAKIQALGLTDAAIVLISEERGVSKPDVTAFHPIEQSFGSQRFVYIGDNPRKDFKAPNSLGWSTIMLVDDGTNIHSQSIEVPAGYRAQFSVDNLSDVQNIVGI